MAPKAKLGDSPIQVLLPPDLNRAVDERARADDRSKAAVIRAALRYYLDETEP